MKSDFAQNWQNGTKNRPYGPPGAAETKIFGVMGFSPIYGFIEWSSQYYVHTKIMVGLVP